MRKVLILLLVVLVIVCFTMVGCSWMFEDDDNSGSNSNGSGNSGNSNSSNNNTNKEPEVIYTGISTVEELKGLANQSGKYKLLKDIHLTGEWKAIEGFSGLLEGDNKTISGLSISDHYSNMGLFSTLKGTVQNLKLTDVEISATGDAGTLGALCGTNSGTITNVYVEGTINASYYNSVGGIAGVSENTKISQCENNVEINAYDKVGGIVGYLSPTKASTFSGNQNKASVNGNDYVGGIVGSLQIKDDNWKGWTVEVRDSENDGKIVGAGNYVGGIIGNATGNRPTSSDGHTITISSCINNKEIIGEDYTAGLVGYCGNYVTEISACINNADITGNNYVGGYVGYTTTGTLIKIAENNNKIEGKAYIGGIAGATGKMENCTNSGEILSTGVKIESSKSVAYVGGIAGYAKSLEKCTNNSDIFINHAGGHIGGIVGYLQPQEGSNVLQCYNYGNISGSDYVGGIAGSLQIKDDGWKYWTVEVRDSENDGKIVGAGNYVGGIIGNATGNRPTSSDGHTITISSCTNNKEVVGKDYTAGLVGYCGNYVTEISSCTNNADITGNNYVGGYAGYTTTGTLIKIAENNNKIEGKAYVGGIAGSTGKLVNCTNNGEIVSTGVMIQSSSSVSYVGGITGYAKSLEKCTNNSDISVSDAGNYVAGIAGYLQPQEGSNVLQCKNYGNISGSDYVGGVAGSLQIKDDGWKYWTVEVRDSENDGKIVGAGNYVGGIIGNATGNRPTSSDGHTVTISNCTNNNDISGVNYVGGILGYGGDYVDSADAVWGTNTNTGKISGLAYKGDKYGKIK